MKNCIFLLMLLTGYIVCAQPPLTQKQEQTLEELAEKEEAMVEDESLLQQLEIFRKHPVNLNTATAEELGLLQLLTEIQVRALLQYRLLLGNLLHLYELQAVPYWDINTIQKLLPFVTISQPVAVNASLLNGTGTLLLRMSGTLKRSDANADANLGSSQKLFMRYRYNYKNLLQFGWLGDKDAGEPMFREKQRWGFDFNSFHLFIRKRGLIHSLAIGDFTVNLGQGLIQWQALSFKKSSEVTTGKRQSAVLRPYNSAGEYNFHRGIGISLQKKRFMFTAFGSLRRLSANLSIDSTGKQWISSFLTAGLHRTQTEMAERNNIRQQAIGGNLVYDGRAGRWGGNIVYYKFSRPLHKRDEPYNLFSFKGNTLLNYSINYDHTWRNIHLYGEIAAVQPAGIAVLQGLLISLDRKLDASLVIRRLSPQFQSLYSSAFTESSLPSNESGIFMGISAKPVKGLTINIYADIFRFPWLKFRVDAPSIGKEYLIQLTYQPHKKLEVNTRFRFEAKQAADAESNEPLRQLVLIPKTNWRMHITWQAAARLRLRHRVELLWYDREGGRAEQGFLIYNDVTYEPPNGSYSAAARIQLFETEGFNSRIYAFENDIASGYSIPAVYQKGFRYYVNLSADLQKIFTRLRSSFLPPVNMYVRWAQTSYEVQTGSALGPIGGVEYKLGLILFGLNNF